MPAVAAVSVAVKVVVKAPVTPAGLPAGIERLTSYVPADSCDMTDKPGSVALGRFLRASYPVSSYGISRACGTDALSTTEHYEGRGIDWMSNSRVPQQKANADAVTTWLLAKDKAGNTYANARRLGVMYLIWNNKIWGAYNTPAGWRPYQDCGTAAKASSAFDTTCHRNHIHISLSWEGAMGRTSFWSKKVAAPDYGPCRVAGFSWAGSYASANPRVCRSVAAARPEAGSSALHAALVRSSGITVRRGHSGPVVVAIQQLVGAAADGGFGLLTEVKVRAFQRKIGVSQTGVVDYATWRAALKATAPRQVATAPKPVVAKAPVSKYAKYVNVVLQRGSTGSVVKVMQAAMGATADGNFGPLTEAKVRTFQLAHRLTVNGVVTAAVWRAF